MRICIIGCGFIGHHLVLELQDNHKITVFNRSEVHDYRQSLFNQNVYVNKMMAAEVYNAGPEYDCVIYTASTPNARDVKNVPEDGINGILHGPVKVIQNTNMKHFVYLSSSMVYGNFQGSPDEQHPLNPVEPYGIMKAASEQLVKFYCKEHNVPYTIIRPSAVYGERDKIQRVISLYIQAALNNDELIVRGDQQLDFTYVQDLVKGIEQCIMNPKAQNETFNLTRSESIPLFAAASMVIKEIQQGRITTEDHDELYPTRGALNTDKARYLIGYNPKTSLHEGIRRYIKEWI